MSQTTPISTGLPCARFDFIVAVHGQNHSSGQRPVVLEHAGNAWPGVRALVPAQVTLLGMGPLGWVGLGLMLGGIVLVTALEDDPVENWLKNGPCRIRR